MSQIATELSKDFLSDVLCFLRKNFKESQTRDVFELFRFEINNGYYISITDDFEDGFTLGIYIDNCPFLDSVKDLGKVESIEDLKYLLEGLIIAG